MLEIQTIKSNIGYYLFTRNGMFSLPNLIFNGSEKVEPTFDRNWFFLKSAPLKIQKVESSKKENWRYELKDKTLADRFKTEYKIEDIINYDNDCGFKLEFFEIKGLYEEKFDTLPERLVDVEFKLIQLAEIEEIKNPTFSYKVVDRYKQEITEKDVTYNSISKIITPSILLPQTPVSITSEQMYKLVRAYIKENINTKVSVITSDYDFCFTVKKRVTLAETCSYVRDEVIWGKSRRKPKKIEVFVDSRDVQIFEMTNAKDNYKGYTVIGGMKGSSVEDLQSKIDGYLKNLVDFINEPVVECANCLGKGVTFPQIVKNDNSTSLK